MFLDGRKVGKCFEARRVMRGEDDSQLVALCGGCHKAAEFDGDKKLTYTTEIAFRLSKRAIGGRGKRKSIRRSMWPRCRCCQKQMRKLGRDDICMGCYKSGRALKFRQARMPNG